MPPLQFSIDVRAPERRRISITLVVNLGGFGLVDGELELFVPTWTPGSYLIREYARHFGPVRAADADSGRELAVAKSRKNRYRVVDLAGVNRVRIDYHVYAHELTVRTADLTAEHAYWNHACVLLWPVGNAAVRAAVEILVPTGWDCAAGTPLRRRGDSTFAIDDADLDTLIDAPVLAGRFLRLEREIRGRQHAIALDGVDGAVVTPRFLDHVQRIVEQAADVFGGELPYPQYTVLALFSDSGHGGLEHADSTTLLAQRTALRQGKSYQEFLGLFAHELFHAWNVKRMRPAELWRFDYEGENLTPMLWLAEGFTAYYDDLICRRARLISAEDYLALVAKNLGQLWAGTGRLKQSLAEASFDAWIRYYRPDENSRNSTQNYYGNGALAAMLLDLTIRSATAGQRSLDDALAMLYRETYGNGRGYHLADVVRCLTTAAGQDMGALLRSLTQGPLDPEFGPMLARFGVAMEPIDPDRPYLGFALESSRTIVANVTDDSPAHAAGIAPGDEVLALEGLRVTSERWAEIAQSVSAIGRPMRVLLASRGVVRERVVTPIAAKHPGVRLKLASDLDAERQQLRDGWLGKDPTTAD